MKRLMKFEFNPEGKWATLSGVLMGIAIFAQALDFFCLRDLTSVKVLQLIVALILPLALEAAWCFCIRVLRLKMAEVFSVLGAVCCLLMLMQTFFYGSTGLMILSIFLLLIAGAGMVLIPFGFIPRLFLGGLVLLVVAIIYIMMVIFHRILGGMDWMGCLSDLPAVCTLLALTCFFGDLKTSE